MVGGPGVGRHGHGGSSVSVGTISKRARRAGAGLLVAGLAASMVSVLSAAPGRAAPPAPAAPAGTAAVNATNLASPEEKVKAAGALGINPDVDMLVLDDQAFVLALWRAAEAGTYVKAEA